MLKDIEVPSLFINAKNDYVSLERNIPMKLMTEKENFIQVITPKGGHLEYYVSRNGIRWCNGAAAGYLRN